MVYSWLLQRSKMSEKAVDNFSHALRYVFNCYKTQKICNDHLILILLQYNFFLKSQATCGKGVNICPFVFDCVLKQYMTQ